MKLFSYAWEDGSTSVIYAGDSDEAYDLLEQTYGDVDERKLQKMDHFLATFAPVEVEADDGEVTKGWDVSVDEETESILADSSIEMDEEDED